MNSDLIERNRRDLDEVGRLRDKASPVFAGLDAALTSRLRELARGSLLDVGCGAMPCRALGYVLVVSKGGGDRHG